MIEDSRQASQPLVIYAGWLIAQLKQRPIRQNHTSLVWDMESPPDDPATLNQPILEIGHSPYTRQQVELWLRNSFEQHGREVGKWLDYLNSNRNRVLTYMAFSYTAFCSVAAYNRTLASFPESAWQISAAKQLGAIRVDWEDLKGRLKRYVNAEKVDEVWFIPLLRWLSWQIDRCLPLPDNVRDRDTFRPYERDVIFYQQWRKDKGFAEWELTLKTTEDCKAFQRLEEFSGKVNPQLLPEGAKVDDRKYKPIYRKAFLRYHPDRNGDTPEARELVAISGRFEADGRRQHLPGVMHEAEREQYRLYERYYVTSSYQALCSVFGYRQTGYDTLSNSEIREYYNTYTETESQRRYDGFLSQPQADIAPFVASIWQASDVFRDMLMAHLLRCWFYERCVRLLDKPSDLWRARQIKAGFHALSSPSDTPDTSDLEVGNMDDNELNACKDAVSAELTAALHALGVSVTDEEATLFSTRFIDLVQAQRLTYHNVDLLSFDTANILRQLFLDGAGLAAGHDFADGTGKSGIPHRNSLTRAIFRAPDTIQYLLRAITYHYSQRISTDGDREQLREALECLDHPSRHALDKGILDLSVATLRRFDITPDELAKMVEEVLINPNVCRSDSARAKQELNKYVQQLQQRAATLLKDRCGLTPPQEAVPSFLVFRYDASLVRLLGVSGRWNPSSRWKLTAATAVTGIVAVVKFFLPKNAQERASKLFVPRASP